MNPDDYPQIVQGLFADREGKMKEDHMVDEHHVQVRFFGHDYKKHNGASLAIELLEKLTSAGWLIRKKIPSTLIALMVLTICGCKSDSNSLQEKFPELSGDFEIKQFWFSGLGMDHCFLWTVTSDSFPNEDVLTQSGFEVRKKQGGLSSEKHPAWWPDGNSLRRMTAYYQNEGNEFRIIWLNRKSKFYYLTWFDT
ncbi:MAG: hypothetical protein ACFE0O_12440 [Opitutales bacterium]